MPTGKSTKIDLGNMDGRNHWNTIGKSIKSQSCKDRAELKKNINL